MNKERLAIWRKGLRDGLPIMMGYLAVSFTFGIASRGWLSPAQAAVMAATNYTSAGQFSALQMIRRGVPYLELVITQIIINSRYFLMSCSLSQKLGRNTPFWHRAAMAWGITDEIFGVSTALPGKLDPVYFYGVMSAAMPGWVLGTLLGALSGNILPARVLGALGVSLYGMFIAVIVPKSKGSKVVLGIVLTSMALSFFFEKTPGLAAISPGVRIIILTVLIAGGAAFLFPIGGKTAGDQGAGSLPAAVEGCHE